MKFLNDYQLKSGIESFRLAKLRNFWTMLGIIVGVASVILVIGISEGVKLQIADQINHNGSDIITVEPNAVQVNGTSLDSLSLLSGLSVSGTLSNQDISRIANTKGVKETVPMSAITANVKASQSSYNNGLIIGTSPDFLDIMNQSMQYGSFLSSSDSPMNSVVVGSQADLDLFNEDVPLGQTVTINGQPFVVRGILNAFTATPLSSGAEFNKALFISYANIQNLTNNTATTYQILVKPDKSSQVKSLTNTIYNRLLSIHGGQNNFKVFNQTQNLADKSSILQLITKLIIGVSAISLFVGGIGIMNVMLVSITERMHEIGIRKALGATNRQILNQFLLEATILSLMGGIFGIILAYIIDLIFRIITNIQPSISLKIVLLACLVSVAIGIIFGTFPAVKAARKDPIDALRSE